LLVVEDDPTVGASLVAGLEHGGYAVDLARDGEDALHRAAGAEYDAVLLDLGLPGLGGLDVLRRLRATAKEVPIIVVTARDAVADRVRGLDAGADDYLVKPFALDEVLARVRALLRRRGPKLPAVLTFADLTLDPARRQAKRSGQLLDLTPRELSILEFFLRSPDIVLTRSMIAEHVWDDRFESFSNVIDVHVRNLRRKLEALGPPLIQTVRGEGYALRASA
jgi:DNA-binding response OmpR family regulator